MVELVSGLPSFLLNHTTHEVRWVPIGMKFSGSNVLHLQRSLEGRTYNTYIESLSVGDVVIDLPLGCGASDLTGASATGGHGGGPPVAPLCPCPTGPRRALKPAANVRGGPYLRSQCRLGPGRSCLALPNNRHGQ